MLRTLFYKTARICVLTMLIAAMLLSNVPATFAVTGNYGQSSTEFRAYANDTVAGYTTTIKTSQVFPEEDLVVEVTKPSGSIVRLPLAASADGYGKVELNGYHTQKAGVYKIAAYVPGNKTHSTYSTFEVFADSPSTLNSQVTADKKIASADGRDTVFVKVQLLDDFENPVKDHMVKLISSRTEDDVEVVTPGGISNETGEVIFRMSSYVDGLSSLTAIDVTTSDIIDDRLQIVFQKPVQSPIGGVNTVPTSVPRNSFFGASLLAQANNSSTTTAAAATIKLSSSSTQVAIGELFSITVEVFTNKGDPALDYRGTIEFSSNDADATLPRKSVGSQYTFTGTEQGRKTFSQAVTFTTPGQKTIEVRDTEDDTLKDTITIIASDGSPTTFEDITILTPQEGILTTSDVLVKGEASAFMNLKVYDNDVEVAQPQADENGAFETILRSLADGTHVLTVKGFDQSDAEIAASDPVQFTLRASAPWVNSTVYSPAKSEYILKETVTVTITSEPKLNKAIFVLDGVDHIMTESTVEPGTYTTSVQLPETEGSYQPRVRLTNQYGVPANIPINQSLVVKGVEFNLTSVQYTLTDDATVKVVWERPVSTTGIEEYRIAYGTDASSLNDFVSIETAKASHIFTELAAGTMYYFQFQVVGANGVILKKGVAQSIKTPDALAIVNAVTVPGINSLGVSWQITGPTESIVRYRILYGIQPDTYTKEIYVQPNEKSVLVEALATEQPHYIRIQGYDRDERAIVQSEEISGTPLAKAGTKPVNTGGVCTPGDVENLHVVVRNNKKYLMWNPTARAEKYRIYMGTSKGVYNLPQKQTVNTSFEVPALDTSVSQYYFAVTALCADGESRNFSNEVLIATGPAAMIFMIFSIFAAFYYRNVRRRKEEIRF